MVIDDFNVVEIVPFKPETDAKLVIDANAVLSLPVSGEYLQMICRWDFQVLQTSCIVDHDQFP